MKSTIYYIRNKYFIDLFSNLLFIFTIVDGQYINENARKSIIKDLQTEPYYGQDFTKNEENNHNLFGEMFHFDKENIHLLLIVWARALFYLKLLSIGRIFRIIGYFEELSHEWLVEGKSQSLRITFNNAYGLAKIMFQVLLVQHLLTCFWIMLSDFGNDQIKDIYIST